MKGLKDKPRVDMIDNEIQDNNAMNGVSYFFHYVLPSLCEIVRSN